MLEPSRPGSGSWRLKRTASGSGSSDSEDAAGVREAADGLERAGFLLADALRRIVRGAALTRGLSRLLDTRQLTAAAPTSRVGMPRTSSSHPHSLNLGSSRPEGLRHR